MFSTKEQCLAHAARMREKWADPVVRERILSHQRLATKSRSFRETCSAVSSARWATPEGRARMMRNRKPERTDCPWTPEEDRICVEYLAFPEHFGVTKSRAFDRLIGGLVGQRHTAAAAKAHCYNLLKRKAQAWIKEKRADEAQERKRREIARQQAHQRREAAIAQTTERKPRQVPRQEERPTANLADILRARMEENRRRLAEERAARLYKSRNWRIA